MKTEIEELERRIKRIDEDHFNLRLELSHYEDARRELQDASFKIIAMCAETREALRDLDDQRSKFAHELDKMLRLKEKHLSQKKSDSPLTLIYVKVL